MEELSLFKELGFPAMAFGALWVLIKSLIAELRAMNVAADARITEQANRHAAEREQWRDCVDRMTVAIERLFDKPCQTIGRSRLSDTK